MGEGGQGAAQEECVLNKADDAFPTLETMAVEVELVPAHLAVGATPWSLAPVLSPPTQKASRRCTHCASEKTPKWLRGPDGPGTLCNACGLRFYKGRLLHSAVLTEVPSENDHDMAIASGSHAALPQEAPRQCTHCESKKTPRWLWGPNGPNTLCNACGLRFYKGQLLNSYSTRRRGNPSKKHRRSKENDSRVLVEGASENSHDMSMAPWSLAPLPQEVSRRCMHCASEKTSRWLRGPDGPSTLCNACGQRFKKGRLLESNSRPCRGHRSSNSAAGNDVAALVEALPYSVVASLDGFFDQMGSEVPWDEAGPERAAVAEEEEELEWLSNKDAFPSVETMALEVEEASALDALPAAARTKNRRRVTAKETCRQANVPPTEKDTVVSPVLPRRRCTHCATEEATAWRAGPEGPYTLCNPCGIVFGKKGRLLPEYRPANSPTFSRHLHSNKYSRALEMHRRNEASATDEVQVELVDPPANGLTSSPLQGYSSLRHVLDERRQSGETSAAEARPGEESMEVQLLPDSGAPTAPPAGNPSSLVLVSHRRVLKRSRKSDCAAACLTAMDN